MKWAENAVSRLEEIAKARGFLELLEQHLDKIKLIRQRSDPTEVGTGARSVAPKERCSQRIKLLERI
ncbi:hypothetical protein [Pyrobaculum aerophilum]|uniref:hypothetical protein n=1 Tax=Pyrobaculum aerophilum TaxID=13773 RepID=UPI002FDADDC8